MGMFNLFKPAMRRFEDGDRWCEVGKLRSVFFEGRPCYEISGRGHLDYYLNGEDPLYIEETRDGWTVGYRPGDDDFDSYASALAATGDWG